MTIKVDWPEQQIEAWIKLAKGRVNEFASEFVQELSNEVIAATPVKTGHLRRSWFPSLNGRGAEGEAGKGTDAQVIIAASKIQPGDTFSLVNKAAYAMRVEYGFVGRDSLGRAYNQPGRAFVRGTIARAPQIAERVAKRVGRD